MGNALQGPLSWGALPERALQKQRRTNTSSEVLKEYSNHLTLEKRLEPDFNSISQRAPSVKKPSQGRRCILTLLQIM